MKSSMFHPANDARDMKDALESLGFTVDLVVDGGPDQMESAAMRRCCNEHKATGEQI